MIVMTHTGQPLTLIKEAVVNVTLRSPFPIFPLPMVDLALIRNHPFLSLLESLNTFSLIR